MKLVATLGSGALAHDGGIRAIAYTPDGARLVAAGDGAALEVWDAATGVLVKRLAGERGLYTVAVSRDGKRVFAGGNAAQVFELRTGKRSPLPVKKPLVVASAFLPDGSLIFGDDRVPRWFGGDGAPRRPLTGHQSRVDAIAVSADGTRALTCGGDRKVKLHALDGKKPAVIDGWRGYAKACGFAPTGEPWSVGWDHVVVRGFARFAPKLPVARAAAMSADGRLAIALADEVAIFAPPANRPVATIEARGATSLAFSPDGARLAVADAGRGLGEGCAIRVYDVATGARVLPAGAWHADAVEAVAVSSHVLFSLGRDGEVLMSDVDAGEVVERIGRVAGQGVAIACTRDRTRVATATANGELQLWDVRRLAGTVLPTSGRSCVGIAISPDDRWLAFAPYLPGEVSIYDLATRARVLTIADAHAAQMCAIAFAGSDIIVTSSADRYAHAWRVPTGDSLHAFGCRGFVEAVCVVGGLLVTGSEHELVVWDVATGAWRMSSDSGAAHIEKLCAIDATRFACVREHGDSSLVEVWEIAATRLVRRASRRVEHVRSIAAGGDRLYAGTNVGRVLVLAP